MRKTAPVFPVSDTGIPVSQLARYLRGWVLEGEIRGFSERTLKDRREYVRHLLWFVESREFDTFGPDEARRLLAHVRNGHREPGGRWGTSPVPVKPRTIQLWYVTLAAFQNYLLAEELINAPFLRPRDKPQVQQDDVQPFTPEQIEALHAASRRTLHARRDEALVLFLLDNGVRASELCAVQLGHVDFQGYSCRVLGKGGKERTVPFGVRTKKALWRYVHEGPERDLDTPLFASDRGTSAGEALTRSGLYQIIRRLGREAGIQACRCSPHIFRHTFAISWLRNGGGELTLMKILGHTNLKMTQKYAKLANADVLSTHRLHSPTDRLLGGRG